MQSSSASVFSRRSAKSGLVILVVLAAGACGERTTGREAGTPELQASSVGTPPSAATFAPEVVSASPRPDDAGAGGHVSHGITKPGPGSMVEVLDEGAAGEVDPSKPATSMGLPAKTGPSRKVEDIHRVLRRHRPGLGACYNAARSRVPGLSVKCTVRFTIATSGSTAKRTITCDRGDDTFKGCIDDVFAEMDFGKAADPQKVSYPLRFTAVE